MGKPRTLRSSLKAIHGAISSLVPVPSVVCMHQSRTDSLRLDHINLLTSFGSSIYYTAPSSSPSSSSSAASSSVSLRPAPPPADPTPACCRCPSSCSSASSSPPAGPICTQRFFFSPRTTKSIMEEACLGGKDIADSPPPAKPPAAFCEESVPLVVSSHDPYRDFRVSMEEMVEAHELRDWSGLQELLECYLHLNDRKTHKIILVAFVDLLMSLVCPEAPSTSSSSSTSASTLSSANLPTSPCSSPFLQLCSD